MSYYNDCLAVDLSDAQKLRDDISRACEFISQIEISLKTSENYNFASALECLLAAKNNLFTALDEGGKALKERSMTNNASPGCRFFTDEV